MGNIDVKIIVSQQLDQHVEIKINKNAKLKDLLSEASKSENMKGINYFKFVLPDGDLVGPESLNKTIDDLGFENKCTCWISFPTSNNNQTDDDKNKWKDWIDLESISSSQNEKNKDSEADKNNTLTLIIFSYDKEVTRLNVTKNTTMRKIKEQIQQQYNLTNERINELILWCMHSDIFQYLDKTVEEIFDDKEDIEKHKVGVNAQNFDFNLKTSEKEYFRYDRFGCFFKPNMLLRSRLWFSFKLIFCFVFVGKYPVSGKKSELNSKIKYKIIRFFIASLLIATLPALGLGITFLCLSISLKSAIVMTAIGAFLSITFIASCFFISLRLGSKISSKQLKVLEKSPEGYKFGDSVIPIISNHSNENIIL